MSGRSFFSSNSLILTLALIIISSLILSSCFINNLVPEQSFGDLTICTKIDEESGAPLDQKDEFSINVKKIYATIEIIGVNADDNKRFTIINEDTDNIIYDETEKYKTKTDGIIEGYFYVETEELEEGMILLEPGNYLVSFYHNGELKDSTGFEIVKPESEIIEVTLASQVNESTLEPLNSVNEFKDTDTVFISIKSSYQNTGDIYSVRWYFGDDEIIDVVDLTVTEGLYEPGFATFWLAPEMFSGPGNYKAEVYLNNSLYGKYDFIITGEAASEEPLEEPVDYFTQGSVYINLDYELGTLYPDDWVIDEGEVEEGYLIIFNPSSSETATSIYISVVKEGFFDPEDLKSFSNNAMELILEDTGWVIIDTAEYSGEWQDIENTYNYEEYYYMLEDADGNIYNYDEVYILRDNDIVIFSGHALELDVDIFYEIFGIMIDSLSIEYSEESLDKRDLF
jgi:hypothetical protein